MTFCPVRSARTDLGEADPTDGLARRRGAAAHAVLRYVETLARQATVPVQTVCLDREPAARILDQARTWGADLVVLGRSDLPGPGQPYVGGDPPGTGVRRAARARGPPGRPA